MTAIPAKTFPGGWPLLLGIAVMFPVKVAFGVWGMAAVAGVGAIVFLLSFRGTDVRRA